MTHYIPSNTSYIAALSDDRTYSDGRGHSYHERQQDFEMDTITGAKILLNKGM
jgi:hypothetical protein